ncbi:hydroxymethylglutaryl-CoA lyase [Desulforhopalus sp. IMCC35007]|uniref:hydroxymethylglutaryl-CoA lyase n=1 Tax=Desulforhopalus sp. IMCC35007 TaxID=2569543 RepID=UPI00145E437E|nr:hydroxymethylglutaryl-CoA lyase [Desulforhopalus sp. IMCC35007]
MTQVLLEDETLRDGLQAEQKIFSLEEKIFIYQKLLEAGVRRVQVGSFVHPRIVPQMAETAEFVRAIHGLDDNCLLTALVLNAKGLERAMECGLTHLTMSVSVSDSHSRKNAGVSSEIACRAMEELIRSACHNGITVRAGIQCAFGCTDEGPVHKKSVVDTAVSFSEAGAIEINLADTAGMAQPEDVRALIPLVKNKLPDLSVSMHAHDTSGFGLANMQAAYEAGVRIFDTTTGGLGGCPFVQNAGGNVATEDAVELFDSLGAQTGVDQQKIRSLTTWIYRNLGRNM